MIRRTTALFALALPLFAACAATGGGGLREVVDASRQPVTYLLKLEVKSGQLAEFKAVMSDLVEATKREPGTLMYEWYLGEDGQTAHILERFEDTAAYLTHGEGFAPFAERFLGSVTILSFTVYGDPDAEAREALAGVSPTYMGPLGGFRRTE